MLRGGAHESLCAKKISWLRRCEALFLKLLMIGKGKMVGEEGIEGHPFASPSGMARKNAATSSHEAHDAKEEQQNEDWDPITDVDARGGHGSVESFIPHPDEVKKSARCMLRG